MAEYTELGIGDVMRCMSIATTCHVQVLCCVVRSCQVQVLFCYAQFRRSRASSGAAPVASSQAAQRLGKRDRAGLRAGSVSPNCKETYFQKRTRTRCVICKAVFRTERAVTAEFGKAEQSHGMVMYCLVSAWWREAECGLCAMKHCLGPVTCGRAVRVWQFHARVQHCKLRAKPGHVV